LIVDARSDGQIVAAVVAGDVDSYTQLVRRYRDRYIRFAVRMVGSPDEAEDVLQSAFVRAYRGLARCAEPERFAAWLYTIVVNECRTYISRRARREQRIVYDDSRLAFTAAEQPADADMWREEIERALEQLPVDQREAFLLKHVEELSYDEMEEITGASTSALKMRVKRACERLRELLEGVPQ
jgi:RNA polymerase sigma-70 factor (ECF subfamily)